MQVPQNNLFLQDCSNRNFLRTQHLEDSKEGEELSDLVTQTREEPTKGDEGVRTHGAEDAVPDHTSKRETKVDDRGEN